MCAWEADVSIPKSNKPLELVHSDLCGLFTPVSWNGKRYFVTFTDDFTHFTAVYILTAKDAVLNVFKQYANMAEGHFDSKIRRLRCDNGGEYVGNEFRQFRRDRGMLLKYTVPHTVQQYGVSERLNCTILDSEGSG